MATALAALPAGSMAPPEALDGRSGEPALAKSVRKERMAANIDIFDFDLDAENLLNIGKLKPGESSFFSSRDLDIRG